MRPPRGHDNFGGYGFRGKRNGGGCGSCFDGGSFYPSHDEGPLDEVIEVSSFAHAYEADVVTKLTSKKLPYFDAPIYLQNKTQNDKVDEIFGLINESNL